LLFEIYLAAIKYGERSSGEYESDRIDSR